MASQEGLGSMERASELVGQSVIKSLRFAELLYRVFQKELYKF
jgi:hypothetical protein